MSISDYPKTPEHLMALGFSASFLGLLAFPLLPLSYWFGKLDWRHRWREQGDGGLRNGDARGDQ